MTLVTNSPTAYALTKQELQELLKRIQEIEQSNAKARRRKHPRLRFLRQHVAVKVVQPGGGVLTRVVIAWDLSSGGICVFYPGYLHVGSTVQITLRKRNGQEETTSGNIANCQHLHSVWHSVGVKFRDVIYPKLYVDSGPQGEAEQDSAVDVDSLQGSVLIADDQAMDRLLFSHMIQGSKIQMTEAATGDEALTLLARSQKTEADGRSSIGPFDLIVCDLNFPEVMGEQVIEKLRAGGFKGPIIAITAETTPSRIAAARSAGANGILQKPYTAGQLHATLAHWIGSGACSANEPVYSSLSGDPRHRQLIETYVAQAKAMAVNLHKSIQADDLANVRMICQSMKGTGIGYGFATLTSAAGAALTALDSSCSVGESYTELHRLEDICGRLSAQDAPKRNAVRE